MDIILERMLSLIPKKPDGHYVHGAKKQFCERIGAPINIVSEWEAGKTKSYRNYLHVVAMTYNVSVEWLRGETDDKTPIQKNSQRPNIETAKIALFGGDGEVTDEMWEEALFAAKMIKERYKRKKENSE